MFIDINIHFITINVIWARYQARPLDKDYLILLITISLITLLLLSNSIFCFQRFENVTRYIRVNLSYQVYYQAWEYQALDNTISHCRNVLIQSQAWFWNYWRRKFILKIDFDRGRSDYLFILIVNHFLQMTQSWHCLSKFKGMNNQVILGMTQTRLQLFKHIHITKCYLVRVTIKSILRRKVSSSLQLAH